MPEAVDWLDRHAAPKSAWTADGRTYFTHIEVDTNRPLFVHRRGSNVINGEYYADYEPAGHSADRKIDTAGLRRRYETLKATPPEKASHDSVLKSEAHAPLPRFFVTENDVGSDINSRTSLQPRTVSAARVAQLLGELNEDGYWPVELRTLSHPYSADGAATVPAGFKDKGQVGDDSDTSPYTIDHGPMGISAGAYIRNMSVLIEYVSRR